MAEIITQTVSPKCYCKYEHIMCEFANDRGYCVKTGCSRRIVINDHPSVNKNLVEVVRCKDCKHFREFDEDYKRRWRTSWDGMCMYWNAHSTMKDGFCSFAERKEAKEEECYAFD